jgi:hypothetical protein
VLFGCAINANCHYAECHYAECRYAECRDAGAIYPSHYQSNEEMTDVLTKIEVEMA